MKIVNFIKTEYKYILLLSIGFVAAYFLPVGYPKFDNAVKESFELVKWYAREHVILCLIPAFYIAGAISAFVSSKSVMKYLGAKANKLLAYSVASVSGAILTYVPAQFCLYSAASGRWGQDLVQRLLFYIQDLQLTFWQLF
jgi:uncharacterized membrane protein YraQ (UPF0718 family)